MRTIYKVLSVFLSIMIIISVVPTTVLTAEASDYHVHIKKIIHSIAPTVTTAGLTAGVGCEICDTVLVEQKLIPAIGTVEGDSIASGTCGTSATWTFNTETGALIISGSGAIKNYKSTETRPWEGYKNQIKTIIIKEGITKIGNYAFKELNNLLYVFIDKGVADIANYVFKNCTNLINVTFPDDMYSVGYETFSGCTKLIDVELGSTVINIGEKMFYNCTSLFSVTIPNSVTYIDVNAFENCSNLESVTIGKNVTNINSKAFTGCTSLEDVYYTGTQEEWNKIVFGSGNEPLENARKHFECVISDDGSNNHKYTVENVGATCTEAGYLKITCECGITYEETISGLGHTIVTVEPALPTVTETGHTRYEKCSTCGEVYGGTVIPVLPNEQSYAEFQSSDDFIGVTDEIASTFTLYGVGKIDTDDYFYIDYNIDTVIIGDGITGIGERTFYWWTNDTIIIGDSVKSIDTDAFRECESKTVIIGDGVETIGNDAFWASCIETIEFGKNVRTIGSRIFYGCDDLKSVTIDSENPYITMDEQGVIYNIEKTKVFTAVEYFETKDYVLADTVEEIANFAFYTNPTIESISLPASLKTVGKYAFHACEDLETVYFGGTKEQWQSISIADYNTALIDSIIYFGNGELGGSCGDNAIWHLDETTGVFTVSGTGPMFDYLLYVDRPWHEIRDKIKSVVILNGITETGKNAFNDCVNITSVSLPKTVKVIKGFENCDGLVSITIPNTVTAIDDYAFMGCVNLTSISIPSSVTRIGYEAFYGCRSLTSVTIPDTVTEIEYGIFLDCKNLKTAHIGNGVNRVNGGMFKGCENLTSVTIGYNVTEIVGTAFEGCKSLTHIDLPEGVRKIGSQAFWYCTSLKTINLPSTLTQMAECVFTGCASLTDVYYEGSKAQWEEIKMAVEVGLPLLNARKHYNSSRYVHTYSPTVVPPTCDKQGYTLYTCNCGGTYMADYVEEFGHTYDLTVTPPTCSEQGYTTYTCECGYSYKDNYVDSLGHDIIIDEAIAPDCVNTGLTEGSHCTRCDDVTVEQEVVEATGHSHEAVITPPTCTEQGYTTYTCECGDSFIADYVDATGHNYVDNVCAGCGDEIIILNGWILENDKWAYYVNNEKLTNRWIQDSIDWCYLGADGYCVSNTWKADSKGWCYIGENYRIVRNIWLNDNGKWYFIDANGYMLANQWKKDSVGWVYLGSNGAMLTNAWAKDSIGWCYLGADGYWVKSQWVDDNGKWYFIDANGYMVTGTKVINGKTYKFASNGVWIG